MNEQIQKLAHQIELIKELEDMYKDMREGWELKLQRLQNPIEQEERLRRLECATGGCDD